MALAIDMFSREPNQGRVVQNVFPQSILIGCSRRRLSRSQNVF